MMNKNASSLGPGGMYVEKGKPGANSDKEAKAEVVASSIPNLVETCASPTIKKTDEIVFDSIGEKEI